MSVVHQGRLLTDAILAALAADDIIVGDNTKPPEDQAVCGWDGTPGESDFIPYVVVWPLPGGVTSGTILHEHADAFPIYQITSIGATREQCEWLADKVRVIAEQRSSWSPPGRTVMQVRVDQFGGATPDHTAQPPVHMCPDRYRPITTPA